MALNAPICAAFANATIIAILSNDNGDARDDETNFAAV